MSALVTVNLDVAQIAGLIITAAAVLSALGYLIKKGRRIAEIIRGLAGLVDQELTPNHGSSMKDDVVGIAIAVGTLARDFEAFKKDFYRHLAERTDKTS